MKPKKRISTESMKSDLDYHGREIEIVNIKPTSGKGTIKAARIVHECVLDTLSRRGVIVDYQHEAGIRFRDDWEKAANSTALTADYGKTVKSLSFDADHRMDARKRIYSVLEYCGKEEGSVLIGVCGYNEFASRWLEKKRIPVSYRRGPEILRAALDGVAMIYGIQRC